MDFTAVTREENHGIELGRQGENDKGRLQKASAANARTYQVLPVEQHRVCSASECECEVT